MILSRYEETLGRSLNAYFLSPDWDSEWLFEHGAPLLRLSINDTL
jgi:hypothetical protein